MKNCLLFIFVFSASLVAFSEPANLLKKSVSPTQDPVPKDLNSILSKRADTYNEIFRLERKMTRAWTDPQYTTEEIQQLRKRLRELIDETERVKKEIKIKVANLPELKEMREQIKLLTDQVKELENSAKKASAVKEK